MNAQNESSPLVYDIKDLERDIELLERTIQDLKGLVLGETDQQEAHEIRLVIVENEFAIQEKLKRRTALREAVGLPLDDWFLQKRSLGSEASQLTETESEHMMHLQRLKEPISVEVEDMKGIFL